MIGRRTLGLVAASVGAAVIAGIAAVGIMTGLSANSMTERSGRDLSSIRTLQEAGSPSRSEHSPPASELPQQSDTAPHFSADTLDALPLARFDSVIGGLLGESTVTTGQPRRAYFLTGRAALFGADRLTPIGVLPAVDFLGEPTVVVPVAIEDGWARVLTPARQSLPSANGGTAPAQTSAWIDADLLIDGAALERHIVVSVATSTLRVMERDSILASYLVGVGTDTTPTPTGVTGYLQARYLDPAQNQAVHRVQLTSLHSARADEPYGGSDGGLIGLHYSDVAAGAVSHGCIRLDAEAITAVDALPLGTPIAIEP